jgi:amidase
VTFECVFSQERQTREELEKPPASIDWKKVNPVTGPVYVEGAEPSDVLKISINRIWLRDFGVYTVTRGFGILSDQVREPFRKIVPILNGKARFSKDLRVSINPHIGTIGVAPAVGEIHSGWPGDHGGNMDAKEIKEGADLYLPIFVRGALFAVGDLHACMGDGEICGSGGAVEGDVVLNFSIVKNASLHRPMLNSDLHWFTIASGETLDEAVKLAVADMVDLLMKALKLPFNEAYILASAVCNVRINQAVNPLMTARVSAPEWLFEQKHPI